MIENAIVQGPEIAIGGDLVPDPHTSGAVGDQGLHTTNEGDPGLGLVLHVGDIVTTGVVHVPDHDLPTIGRRDRDRERRRSRDRERERERERERDNRRDRA